LSGAAGSLDVLDAVIRQAPSSPIAVRDLDAVIVGLAMVLRETISPAHERHHRGGRPREDIAADIAGDLLTQIRCHRWRDFQSVMRMSRTGATTRPRRIGSGMPPPSKVMPDRPMPPGAFALQNRCRR
jgi:hypothetical protein